MKLKTKALLTLSVNWWFLLGFIYLFSGTFASRCDRVKKCFQQPSLEPIFTALYEGNTTFRFKVTSAELQAVCNDWNTTKPCYDDKIRYCFNTTERFKYQAIGNLIRYTCTDGYEGFVKHNPCFTSDPVENGLKTCENVMDSQLRLAEARAKNGELDKIKLEREICRLTFGLDECLGRIVEDGCGEEAKELYKNVVKQIFTPVYIKLYCYEGDDCKTTNYGSTFKGKTSVTNTGKECQRWDAQYPHKHSHTNASKFPDETLDDAANYCRNPGLVNREPWCYTTDPDTTWQYCAVRKCQGYKGSSLGTTNWGLIWGCLMGASVLCSIIGFCCKHCSSKRDWKSGKQPSQQDTSQPEQNQSDAKDTVQSDATDTVWSTPESFKPDYGGQNGVRATDYKI